ncbi:27754_t:CDS:1, partial [Dentiscutata erythropus]
MEDYKYFTHVSTSPELVNISNPEQLNSILKICIKKYSQNKKKDDEEIFSILLKLADLGLYPEAEYFLSLLYINKQGITEEDTDLNLEYAKQFNKWLRQAAEKGHAKAME